MTRDRGEYRAIYEVLFDGKDWCALKPEARLVWLALKCTLGAAGINAVPAAEYVLAVRTGYEPGVVRRALEELRSSGWIEAEGTVIWVKRGLDFEPTMNPANDHHRKFIERHLASLPRLAILDHFRSAYPLWFPGAAVPSAARDEGYPDTPGRPSEGDRGAISITSPSPSTSTSPSTTTSSSRGREGPSYHVRSIVALNRALAARPELMAREVAATEMQGVVSWEADGIPIELVERVIAERVANYRPTPRNRQPSSLRYFDAAVRQAWELQQQPKDVPPPAQASAIGRVRTL